MTLMVFAMPTRSASSLQTDVPASALGLFLVATFGLTWGIIGAYIVVPDVMAGIFGDLSGAHPLFFLATWSPALAGFLVVYLNGGLPGWRAFLLRLVMWRGSWGWVTFILIVLPLVFVAGSLLKGGPVLAPVPPEGVSAVLAVMVMMLFLGPVEEFGWRGVMQPLLQRHMAPLWAGLIIGATWGIWHLPAFFLAGVVFADWNFLPFFVGNVTLAVLVTPIFNSARGSLLWPMLFHWQLINPFWADAQPWDTWILVAITLVVVWWNRDAMFTRDSGVTDVIPAPEPCASHMAQ
ncbi:CPBP family intramembrane glutamic endopeptidase [Marivita sp. S2033]